MTQPTSIDVIDPQAWPTLCREHAPSFDAVLHVQDVVRYPEQVRRILRDSLANATAPDSQMRTGLPRMRVFDGSCLDYAATEKVTHTVYSGGEVREWLTSASGLPDPCLAFNAVETWSADARDLINRELVEPMVAAGGELPRGFDAYAFIASRGYTAFGIHTDPEPSLLFHLGPAPKKVWIWSQQTLGELPHRRNITLQVDGYLPSADHHLTLQTGDFLCIPGDTFHLLENQGFSMFLGLSVYRPDPVDEMMDAIATVLRDDHGADPATVVGDPSFAPRAQAALLARQERRRNRAFGGPSRPLPVTDADVPVRVSSLPLTVGDQELRTLGRRVQLPVPFDHTALAEALAPGNRVDRESLAGILDGADRGGTARAAALVTALLQTGALVAEDDARE